MSSEVSGGRLVREEQQRGLSTGARVMGREEKKVTEWKGEERRERMGPGGKDKVDSTSHDVVKVCAGG